MNCSRIQELLTDFEAGALAPDEAELVRAHLETCPACQVEWKSLQAALHELDRLPAGTPSPRLREGFYAMLAKETAALSRSPEDRSLSVSARGLGKTRLGRRFWTPFLKIAAPVALLAVGAIAGVRFGSVDKRAQEATVRQLAATQKELSELRSRIDSVDQFVAYSLSQRQPAHTRLQQVAASLDANGKNEPMLAQLLSTLAFDPSTNVRLSALETLYAHAQEAGVCQGVLAALPRETSPLVQVAMIDFLVAEKDRDALAAFQQIANTLSSDPLVRTAAERAITFL